MSRAEPRAPASGEGRGHRRLAALALALGGCMRIYPDPELPDVVVEWLPDLECAGGADRVVVSLSAGDPAAEVAAAAAPCSDGSLTLADVARQRYSLAARLEDADGVMFGRFDTDLDLRAGLSKRVTSFFGQLPGNAFRVTWTFDMGASCAALAADTVRVRASMPGAGPLAEWELPCDVAAFMNAVPTTGAFTLSARALAGESVVAVSPESAPVLIHGAVTDFGTLVLSPCGAACPPL